MIVRESLHVNHCRTLLRASGRPGDYAARGTLLQFFDNVHFVLRLYGTHRLSTTEQKEVTRNDEKIVHLASPLPHPQYLP